jgi:uncharacterized protein with HEPN domain
MPRDLSVHLSDILGSIRLIEQYLEGYSFEKFSSDQKTVDAVVRNLEIIGEAVKRAPADARTSRPEIEWKKIGALRDLLIHEYFGVDLEILWDVVKNKLPGLKVAVGDLLSRSEHPPS